MDDKLKKLINDLKSDEISTDEFLSKLSPLLFESMDHATVDHHRLFRTGFPEVIFCQGKTLDQIISITESILKKQNNVLATRVKPEHLEKITDYFPQANINKPGNLFSIKVKKNSNIKKHKLAIITAGTSDIPVAEEAKETALLMDLNVVCIYDIGVAGIHRIFNKWDEISNATVTIVIAGMEGALPSVIGGLLSCPVIAVPTSVGYGASFNGLSALLGMLNSCAPGISVVNIDNGFGAVYCAYRIINSL